MGSPFRGDGPFRGRVPFVGRGPWAGRGPWLETLGPELVPNGDGSSTTGWDAFQSTASSVGGVLRFTSTVNGLSGALVYSTLPSPRSYRYSFTVTANPAGRSFTVYVRNTDIPVSGVGTYSGTVTSSGTSQVFSIFISDAAINDYFEIDNISIRDDGSV